MRQGLSPEYDFTAQYILVVDDLFLHYAATTVTARVPPACRAHALRPAPRPALPRTRRRRPALPRTRREACFEACRARLPPRRC